MTLPAGYELVTTPNGSQHVHFTNCKTHYIAYSLEAWAQIEKGKGLWKDAHNNIFGK